MTKPFSWIKKKKMLFPKDTLKEEGKMEKKFHRCLGLDCKKLIPKGKWFCEKCQRKRKKARLPSLFRIDRDSLLFATKKEEDIE